MPQAPSSQESQGGGSPVREHPNIQLKLLWAPSVSGGSLAYEPALVTAADAHGGGSEKAADLYPWIRDLDPTSLELELPCVAFQTSSPLQGLFDLVPC